MTYDRRNTFEKCKSFDRQRMCPQCGKRSPKFIQKFFAQNNEPYRGNLKILRTEKNAYSVEHQETGTIYHLWDYSYRGFPYGEFCRYDCAVQYANFRFMQDVDNLIYNKEQG